MNRKTRPVNGDLAKISTQEYICRVQEDDGEEFSGDPWIRALDGLVDATPLRDVKKCMSFERIDKVTIAYLKDKPTQTTQATSSGVVVMSGVRSAVFIEKSSTEGNVEN